MWDTEVRIICCLDKCSWHRTGRMILLLSATDAITSDFLLSITPGWVVIFLDSLPILFTFLSLLDLLGFALAFRISNSSNYFQSTDTGIYIYITSFEKYLESSSGLILWPSKFGKLECSDPINRFNNTPVGWLSLCNQSFWWRFCVVVPFWIFLGV